MAHFFFVYVLDLLLRLQRNLCHHEMLFGNMQRILVPDKDCIDFAKMYTVGSRFRLGCQ